MLLQYNPESDLFSSTILCSIHSYLPCSLLCLPCGIVSLVVPFTLFFILFRLWFIYDLLRKILTTWHIVTKDNCRQPSPSTFFSPLPPLREFLRNTMHGTFNQIHIHYTWLVSCFKTLFKMYPVDVSLRDKELQGLPFSSFNSRSNISQVLISFPQLTLCPFSGLRYQKQKPQK